MVAVAEKPQARTRFDRIREALEQRRSDLASKRSDIERYTEAERLAVEASIREQPAASPYRNTSSPAHRARRKRVEAEASIGPLELEVQALEREAAEAVHAAAQELVEERITEARQLVRANETAWGKLGEQYNALFFAWLDVVETAERLDGHVGDTLSEELVKLAPEIEKEVKDAGRLPVRPFPISFQFAIELMTGVAFSLDQRMNPHHAALAELTPDLRTLARSPRLSGRIDRYDPRTPEHRGKLNG